MLPSTRAGQTGRGDDDQTTTSNGQEEGWLMQVVRILQLANPALSAEEAIVRAMGLVNISNQAPRGETEKIPKDVSSSIAHIKKLSDSNWHTWEPTFIDCLQRVHNAKEILYGTVVPRSEEYNEDLDKALVGLIHACCDNSPDSRIDTYTVRGVDEEVQLGSTLYAKLKKALTLNDAVKRAGLQDRIHTVRLHNRDVVRLGKELDSIWNDAARLGKRFNEDLKKSTLYRCMAQDWFYANTVDALKTARPDCKYDEAYHALAKKQQDGKQTRARMSQSESERMEAPLELVHVDLMTDFKGHANYHYALVAVDDFSSLIYVEPLCTKSAALTALRRWIARMEWATDRKLKTLRSDNGGEWCSIAAEDWQTQEGFKWQKSVPGISVQNGRVERAIRSVQEKMRSMLIGRACPRELWPYAITAAAHVMNLTPSATKTIPHEAFYGTTAHKLAQQLRVFGCLAWVHVQQKDQQGKHGARAKPAIMIGYDDEHKAWKFCNPDQPVSIQWSNSATFHEDKGWSDRQQEAVRPVVTVEVEEEGVTPAIVEEETRSETAVEDLLPAVDSTVGAANTAILNLDPTLGEAMNGEDTQLWKEAIRKELEGLEAMGTWEVVHQPPGVPLVDSKVVLQLKLDADGVPVKHKARLVARGFTQREGIDYQETFSPVAPLGAIRAILALAVQNNWEVHALDITMAYLNSTLKEAIYMKPPEGSGVAPGKVYKVVKGLYGLKQSGQEWNQEFDRSLRCMGFFQVECTPCIYTKGQGEDMAIVVIYVDDTLVIAPRLEMVLKVKKQIGQRWKMEDSGYIDQVLAKHLDKRTKPTMVPMQSIPEGTLVASAAQQKEYPVIVGKLLWVANSTRPDLSLTMGVLARHMREPSQEHYQAAQRVLRYLESTRQVGLVYRASESQEPLVAHSDANWASDATIQRRSTSGSVALVYRNPVAWKSATQKCVSLSAVEAEFIAATEATHEVLFLKQLLRSIGIATGTPTVYSDNTGCIQVSKDPAQHWKLKHIDTKYHFVCNNVQEGRVQIKYVDTTRNLADVLTKPIGRQAMQQARSGLHLQIPAAVYGTGSPSYATVLKNGGHTLKQQHNEQGTYAVEGGS
ncbi:hypothetical protein NDA12_004937 [Ustilago hordei]|nr:hypothetical protein NDA12_004937 [Ustilago hordei]